MTGYTEVGDLVPVHLGEDWSSVAPQRLPIRPDTARQPSTILGSASPMSYCVCMTSLVAPDSAPEKDRSFNYFRKIWIDNRC
jgi:hypothetical protein